MLGGDKMVTNGEKMFVKYIQKKIDLGLKQGIKQGLKQGKKSGIIQVVKNMIKQNISDDIIIKSTEIDAKELQKIKNEIK